ALPALDDVDHVPRVIGRHRCRRAVEDAVDELDDVLEDVWLSDAAVGPNAVWQRASLSIPIARRGLDRMLAAGEVEGLTVQENPVDRTAGAAVEAGRELVGMPACRRPVRDREEAGAKVERKDRVVVRLRGNPAAEERSLLDANPRQRGYRLCGPENARQLV